MSIFDAEEPRIIVWRVVLPAYLVAVCLVLLRGALRSRAGAPDDDDDAAEEADDYSSADEAGDAFGSPPRVARSPEEREAELRRSTRKRRVNRRFNSPFRPR